MADDFLVALTGILGGALLTAATLAAGFHLRRVHELRDRILALEARLEVLRPVEELVKLLGAEDMQRMFRKKGGRPRA